MKIKWTFVFQADNISIDVMDETEDQRIVTAVNASEEILFISGKPREVCIRLDSVKLILREPVDETNNQTSIVAESAVVADASPSINQEAAGAIEEAQIVQEASSA